MKICIIGAGPSGCAVVHALKSKNLIDFESPENSKVEVKMFEKQSQIGGLWNLNYRTGTDANGQAVHSSMYRDLFVNAPCEALEFPDYTYEQHFGKKLSSYPPRAVLEDYMKGRYENKELLSTCRFNTAVEFVDFNVETDKFQVRTTDLATEIDTTEDFDYVFVCSGHYHKPNVVEYPGFDNFSGKIMHAHDFKDGRLFKDQTIMTIGSSYSAEDIASLAVKFGAKRAYLSARANKDSPFFMYNWPDSDECLLEVKPILERVEGNTVFFSDGTQADVDCIILCTGYKHSYPFIKNSLRYVGPDSLCPEGFYKGMFWMNNPKMMYIGVFKQYFTFPFFDAQANYALQVLMNNIEIPDLEGMKAEFEARKAVLDALPDVVATIKYQSDYIGGLNKDSGFAPELDSDLLNKNFVDFVVNKIGDIRTFRERTLFKLDQISDPNTPTLPPPKSIFSGFFTKNLIQTVVLAT